MVVARDIAHAKLKERLDAGEDLPAYFKDHMVYYAGPAKEARGSRLGLLRSDDRRPHGLLRRPIPEPRWQHGDARQGQPLLAACATPARSTAASISARSVGRPRASPITASRKVECAGVRGTRHGGDLAHRGRGLPRLHRGRRQGQRLLRGPARAADTDG